MLKTLRKMLALMMLTVSSSPSFSFTWNNYRSGMSQQEVEAISRRDGWGTSPISTGGFMQMRTAGPSGGEFGLAFTFCENRLTSVTDNIKGGLDAFVNNVMKFQQSFGPGTIVADSNYTQNGLMSRVAVNFDTTDQDRWTVSMHKFMGHEGVSVNVFNGRDSAPCRAR